MFNHKRLIFSAAEVGHHGEIVSKLAYSWFNDSMDDVSINPANNHIKFSKVSLTPYGKPLLYGMLFGSNRLNSILKDGIDARREATRHIPAPERGKFQDMNVQWPMLTTIHFKDSDFNMTEQINTADSEYLSVFTPYNGLDEDCYRYLFFRHRWFSDYYATDAKPITTIRQEIQEIKKYELLTNANKFSLIYDIVHNTHKTLDEMSMFFGTEPVTDINRMRRWLDTAHESFKIKFLGDPRWHTLTY